MDIKYPKEAGIYKFTCNMNGKIYIGKSVNLYSRLGDHRRSCKRSEGRCYFENALVKYGWDSFKVEILEVFINFNKSTDNEFLLNLETDYISMLDSDNKSIGYNRCRYSRDRTGTTHSEETKEKIRQHNLGKSLSEETKERISKSSLGKNKTETHKAKLSESNLGKVLSDETKEKMRQSKLGKSLSEKTKEKMRKPKSEEHKQKMRKPKSEETKRRMRESRNNRLR